MSFLSVLLFLCGLPISDTAGRLREFHILNVTMNISDAVKTCQTNYTNIVTIYDEEDNENLSYLVNMSSIPSAFIGARTVNTISTSKWSNGDDVSFTPFTKNCSGICGGVMRENGSWELWSYSNKAYFMCYKEDLGRESNISLIRENKTWSDAQLYCRKNYTDLISIRNEQENERVKNQTQINEFPFWIGLLYDDIEWYDGGKSTYRYNLTPVRNSSFMLSILIKQWTTISAKHQTLCYKSFIHVSKATMIWEDALEYCNNNDAFGLLRIESKEDQIETERELTRQKITDPVWIGLRQSRLFGFWMWVNGLHVGSWSNWKDGRQPEHQLSHHCGAMEKTSNTFKWSDKDCRNRYRALCEMK